MFSFVYFNLECSLAIPNEKPQIVGFQSCLMKVQIVIYFLCLAV